MNISSNFLLLHVKEGRHELFDHFSLGENPLHSCSEELRVPVEIRGYIDGVCGNNDGISIEYGVIVTNVETEPPLEGEPSLSGPHPIRISAESAMLDVKEGRHKLLRHFRRNGHRSPSYGEERRVQVVIRGYIDCNAGYNDNVSAGYSVIVTDLQASGPASSGLVA